MLLITALLTACQQGAIQDPDEYNALSKAGLKAGHDYTVIKQPLPVSEPGKIHIAEFFWYGCGHCFKVERPLQHWQASLPNNVSFEKIPASWKDTMTLHARAHYLAKKLAAPGMVEALFPTILQMKGNNDLDAHRAILQLFFAKHHINKEEFATLWNDETIDSQIERANQWQKQAKITGTPAIVIDGKYLINNNVLEDVSTIVSVADKMVRALLSVDTKENAPL